MHNRIHVSGTEVSTQPGKPTSKIPSHSKDFSVKSSCSLTRLTENYTTPANTNNIINQFSTVSKQNYNEASIYRKQKLKKKKHSNNEFSIQNKLEEREIMGS